MLLLERFYRMCLTVLFLYLHQYWNLFTYRTKFALALIQFAYQHNDLLDLEVVNGEKVWYCFWIPFWSLANGWMKIRKEVSSVWFQIDLLTSNPQVPLNHISNSAIWNCWNAFLHGRLGAIILHSSNHTTQRVLNNSHCKVQHLPCEWSQFHCLIWLQDTHIATVWSILYQITCSECMIIGKRVKSSDSGAQEDLQVVWKYS